MNQKSERISSTLAVAAALIAVAIAALAVSIGGNTTAQTAATIDLLNVGMCVTTDDSVFKESDCDDGDGNDVFNVGDREDLVERDQVYATYAHDPKSASEQPRAILVNADLVKVSITDEGRDRRRSVLYPAVIDSATDYSTLLDSTAGEPVVQQIKDLIADSPFAAMLADEDQISGFDRKEVQIYQPSRTNTSGLIENSGNQSFNFKRSDGVDFEPLSSDKDDDAVIFFGFEVAEPAQSSGTKLTDVNTVAGVQGKVDELKILGAGGSSPSLIADEDRNTGGGNVPPWLSVLANVPNNKDLVVVAVLYETSDSEVIQGGAQCTARKSVEVQGTPTPQDECQANSAQTAVEPNYTKAEIDNRRELVAKVQGDNGYKARNLYLKEEGRFSGRYTGFIRLTDANGNGTFDTGGASSNWGRLLEDADGADEDGAAVVGVQSSAEITYRDSQGSDRTLAISIDIQPPTITIASPTHDSSGDDRSPDFIGSFGDGGAGLADDTFKLYVDNISDGGEGAVGDSISDTEPVLSVETSDYNLTGPAGTGRYQLRRDYKSGNSYATPFGVVDGGTSRNNIYFTETGSAPEASESDNDAKRKIVNSDIYEDGDSEGTFDDDARVEGSATNGREIEVDFQAVVIDLAGNIGFSDADPAGPSLMNDWGTPSADRQSITVNNILGLYSRHIINLDDKDPEFMPDNTITGYYGLDDDNDPVPNDRGIMITFDNDVNGDNITENTFTVELDDKSNAIVVDVQVEKNRVFLRLGADLKSSETPAIAIAAGQRVEDFAGNQLQAREVKAFDAKDGLPPKLTVSLSNGSGTGQGAESSDSLTKNTIVVSVSSDEEIQGAPLLTVLCTNYNYGQSGQTGRSDIDDYIEARTGAVTGTRPGPTRESFLTPKCGTGTGARTLYPNETSMLSRPGMNWEYNWRNLSGDNELPNGKLKVIVLARDRSTYKLSDGNTVQNTNNWGSATTEFTLDTEMLPLVKGTSVDSAAGEVIPRPNQKVSDNPPILVFTFEEGTQVTIEELLVNDADVTERVSETQKNRFVYQPEGLNLGTHMVEVEARDAAGNKTSFNYNFDTVTRSPFVMQIQAGWNAVSLPQDPVDGSLDSVFSNPAIDQVIAYDASSTEPWRMANRQDGVWTTSLGELTNIRAELGYWVNSSQFVSQSVQLRNRQRLGADAPLTPLSPSNYKGWNFVGVVDNDGDQTENHWDDGLRLGTVPQIASVYLGDFVEAYTWNATLNQFAVIEASAQMKIGQGIWVFYREGDDPQ